MRTIYIDCAMGCAGDMLTAALLELHPDREDFLRRMNAALCGKAEILAAPDSKCGIGGTHVSVLIDGEEEGEHDHHHDDEHHDDHHHHHHTSVAEIMEFIDGVNLPAEVRENAKAVYKIIAEAEGKVHGHPVENIHFHEVGSLDALADVLNVCELIYELAPGKILSSPVNVGSGFAKCAHGVLPVPAPATELILSGVPIYSGEIKSELCTPTGAALLKHFAADFVRRPVIRVEKIGYGTGKKDFPAANVVRALLGETEDGGDKVIELACNLDDMTPESLSFAMDELFAIGALDVYFTNIGMKKSRPGIILTCMCREEQRDEMLRCVFRNTTTIGVREYSCARWTLRRSERSVETEFGSVRVKTSEGYGVKREKAEYDDLAHLARENGCSLDEIRASVARGE